MSIKFELTELQRQALPRLVVAMHRAGGPLRVTLGPDPYFPNNSQIGKIDIDFDHNDLGVSILTDEISIGSKSLDIDERLELAACDGIEELISDAEEVFQRVARSE